MTNKSNKTGELKHSTLKSTSHSNIINIRSNDINYIIKKHQRDTLTRYWLLQNVQTITISSSLTQCCSLKNKVHSPLFAKKEFDDAVVKFAGALQLHQQVLLDGHARQWWQPSLPSCVSGKVQVCVVPLFAESLRSSCPLKERSCLPKKMTQSKSLFSISLFFTFSLWSSVSLRTCLLIWRSTRVSPNVFKSTVACECPAVLWCHVAALLTEPRLAPPWLQTPSPQSQIKGIPSNTVCSSSPMLSARNIVRSWRTESEA